MLATTPQLVVVMFSAMAALVRATTVKAPFKSPASTQSEAGSYINENRWVIRMMPSDS